MGLTEAALGEGKTEKARSRVTAAVKAKTAARGAKTKGSPAELLMRREAGHENRTPMILPVKARAADSNNT